MRENTPAAPAVRDTLERVLGSDTFARSERSRDLLRYLVEREQAGEAERLKGFAIAVDVFGKDAGFDPSTDAVVRVQVGRLRELLAQYYAEEGSGDPLRFAIPRGSYVPTYNAAPLTADDRRGGTRPGLANKGDGATFVLAPAAPVLAVPQARAARSAGSSAAMTTRNRRMDWHLRLFWVAMAAVLAMLVFLVLHTEIAFQPAPEAAASRSTDGSASTGSITPAASIEMLPSVHIVVDDNDAAAARVAAVFRSALSGFDTVDFLVGAGTSEAPDKLRFAFDIKSAASGDAVAVELQNVATGKVLMSRLLPKSDNQVTLDNEVADILSASVPVSGVIYGFIEQYDLQSGLTECLLLNDAYYLDQNRDNHRAAYSCFEKLATGDAKSPLVYSELGVLLLETVTDGYGYPADASRENALAMAKRAVQMAPTSPYAHRAYGFLNSGVGNTAESIRWTRKAYELNTYDLSMAAAYGYALIYSGDYANGTPIMRHAVEVSSAHATWWDYALFLGQFMLDDTDGAARALKPLMTARRAHYFAARLIVARAQGDEKQARTLLEELNANYPKFVANPRATYVKAQYPPDLIEKLVDALRDAGLGSAS